MGMDHPSRHYLARRGGPDRIPGCPPVVGEKEWCICLFEIIGECIPPDRNEPIRWWYPCRAIPDRATPHIAVPHLASPGHTAPCHFPHPVSQNHRGIFYTTGSGMNQSGGETTPRQTPPSHAVPGRAEPCPKGPCPTTPRHVTSLIQFPRIIG